MLKRVALVLALSMPLGACVVLDIPRITAGVNQPASLDTQYEIEAAAYSIRVVTSRYFRLRQCRASEVASLDNLCAQRSTKVALQAANRRVQVALVRFRADPTALTAIKSAIDEYKNVVATQGVQ